MVKALARLETPLSIFYWIAMLICLASVMTEWKYLRGDIQLQLALFAIIAAFINALFMSNLSGFLGRFHTRIVFLPMFAALTIIWRWAAILRPRYHTKILAFHRKIDSFLGE